MEPWFMKATLLPSGDLKVAFLNPRFMKVAFLNLAGRIPTPLVVRPEVDGRLAEPV
jgi:hypothetical protein